MHDDDADQTPADQPSNSDIDDNDENLVEIMNSEPRLPLRRRMLPERKRETVFTLQHLEDRRMVFRVSGARAYQGTPVRGWRVDFGSLNVQMNDMGRFIAAYHEQDDRAGREVWRHTADEIGMHLYNGLMNTDPTLAQHLTAALRRTFPAENLTLVFEGSRDYLSVPYELLHDGHTPLALRYPICRRIGGATTEQTEPFSALIASLKETNAPLKTLLISSGARHVAADQEIELLETSIQENARQADVNAVVEVVWDRDSCQQKLAQGGYPIVHYSGQVYHDKMHPENSGLLFAAGIGHTLITTRDLSGWLRGNAPHLFFISACVGPQTWDEYTLHEHNYFGLLETLVQAGILFVLGFRWYVTNEGRQRFAQHFYRGLFAAPFSPERATLRARQAVNRRDWQDETWASPILIMQHVDGQVMT